MGRRTVKISQLEEGHRANSKVISVMNNKGGCGKTTTAMALGMYLARTGNNVMFWDNDPQCNLTQRLGISDEKMVDRRMNLLYKNAQLNSDLSIVAIYPYLMRIKGSNAKPGNIGIMMGSHFSEIEAGTLSKTLIQGYPDIGHRDIHRYFRERVNFYRDYFDYIIIDTAPALEGNLLNHLTLTSSDNIIYPIDGIEAALGIKAIINWMSFNTEGQHPRPNGLFAMVKYQADTKDVSPANFPEGQLRNTVYRTMKNIFGEYVCDNGVKELRALRHAIPGFGSKTQFTRLSEEITMKIRDDKMMNLFEFVQQNGLMMKYEQELSQIKSKVQRRIPHFKEPRYIA